MAGQRQRRLAIAGSEHAIPGLHQVVAHDFDDVKLVLHDQDCLEGHRIHPRRVHVWASRTIARHYTDSLRHWVCHPTGSGELALAETANTPSAGSWRTHRTACGSPAPATRPPAASFVPQRVDWIEPRCPIRWIDAEEKSHRSREADRQ